MPALATFLREEMDRQGLTQVEIERRTGIPDSTLARILSGETVEPRASQIARIARALGMKFWLLMQIAQLAPDAPGDPSDEAKRLAAAIEARPELRPLMERVEQLDTADREAVEAYILLLQQRRPSGRTRPRSGQEDQ